VKHNKIDVFAKNIFRHFAKNAVYSKTQADFRLCFNAFLLHH